MNRGNILHILIIQLTILSSLLGCGTTQQVLSRISLDMTKEEVTDKIGEPDAVRGSIRNKYGQVVDVWEYRLYQYSGAIPGMSSNYDMYWLYFVDNKLAQWGKAGDWQKDADRIYEMRLR
jgi:hypothetical protein